MPDYVAHSRNESKGVLHEQPYGEHPTNMYRRAKEHLARIKPKMASKKYYKVLEKSVLLAVIYHDMGKLDDQAQKVLMGTCDDKMINHVDAGVAYLLKKFNDTKQSEYLLSALIILAHHIGYPNVRKLISTDRDIMELKLKPTKFFRDDKLCEKYNLGDESVMSRVNRTLPTLVRRHKECCKIREPRFKVSKNICEKFMDNHVLLVLALSILVDCDHEDTSKFYGEIYPQRMKPLKADPLIDKMDKNAEKFSDMFAKGELNISKERFEIRKGLYKRCKRVKPSTGFFLVDGTVGTAKTFGLFRLALQVAKAKKSDTIVGVLPFIALIDQSSEEYRKVLFPDGGDYDLNVIHSVFESKNIFHRKYQRGFNAPINITTSVNWFEIILGNHVSNLKNFHKMAGAVIFIDEYHAIADYKFWPVILNVLNDMHEFMKCNFILSSGTPTPYWDIEEMGGKLKYPVHHVTDDKFYKKMIEMELKRVKLVSHLKEEWDFDRLSDEIISNSDKSIFVVLETRRKTIALFNKLQEKGCKNISLRFSGIAPLHRKKSLQLLKDKMSNGEKIILVATQGADIGLNLSFEVGYKEESNYDSNLQMGGRINRGCEYPGSKLHLFKLSEDPNNDGEKYHPNYSVAYRRKVFSDNQKLWNDLSPEFCQDVAEWELREMSKNDKDIMNDLLYYYSSVNMEDTGNNFNLITLPMIPILVNNEIFKKILQNEYVPYDQIQNNVVNIIYCEKNLEILERRAILIDDACESKKIEDPEETETITKKYNGLWKWEGEYDPVNYGIYADPIWELVSEANRANDSSIISLNFTLPIV